MKLKKFKQLSFILLLFFLGCGQKKDEVQKYSSTKFTVNGEQKDSSLRIKVNFPDTITQRIQNGSLTFRRELPDTLNLKAQDERFLTLYVNYFNNSVDPEIITEKLCDTFVAYSKTSLEKPIELDFWVINKGLKGEKNLRGKLVNQIILHSYSDSSKVRILEEVFYFDKKVYFPN